MPDPKFIDEKAEQLRRIEEETFSDEHKRWLGVRDEAGTIVALAALIQLEGVGYLDNVATFPEARGRGLASAIVAHAIELARAAAIQDADTSENHVGFYLVDGEVRAAVGLDRGGDPELDLDGEMAASARLVSARARPAPAVLADDQTDLWSLT